MKRTRLASMLVAAACAVAVTGPVLAAEQQREQVQAETQTRERIYGSELMTPQERNQYLARMRALKTLEEREQFRKEHHEQMQERAKQRGVTLPDEPPAQGRGMGPRYGDAPGAGRGPVPGPGPAKGR
jgi:hypothetical protein